MGVTFDKLREGGYEQGMHKSGSCQIVSSCDSEEVTKEHFHRVKY